MTHMITSLFKKKLGLHVRKQLLTAGGAHDIVVSAPAALTMTPAQEQGPLRVLPNTHSKVNTSIKGTWEISILKHFLNLS